MSYRQLFVGIVLGALLPLGWLAWGQYRAASRSEATCYIGYGGERISPSCQAGDWLHLRSNLDVTVFCDLSSPPLVVGPEVFCRYLGYQRLSY